MRARSARSFTLPDIHKVSRICQDAGVRSYITLNTVMYDHDMQLLKNLLDEGKKQGIDAVIASDFSVMEFCRKRGIPVHVSTQANVSNIEAVEFFSAFADVIVLARELTLGQVSSIVKEISRRKITGPSGELIKIEIFIHGALCMAISGKCYLSLHTQHAPANRGACAQNCRRPYQVKDLESGEELRIDNEYIMSAKDLCTIHVLDQVMGTGAAMLKIEGRTKGADYTSVVTSCYREAIDAISEKKYSTVKIRQWESRLEKVYNRGFWEGYYLGRKLGEWSPQPGSIATEKKIYVGKAMRYYPQKKVGEFLIETGSISSTDTLMVIGKNIGVKKEKLQALFVNGLQAEKAVKGDLVTIPLEKKLTPTDKLYKIIDSI